MTKVDLFQELKTGLTLVNQYKISHTNRMKR